MIIQSLSFTRDAKTPIAPSPGIVIAVDEGRDPQTVIVRGALRIAQKDSLLQGVDVPHSVFLTAIDSLEQRPFTLPLVGPRLVFLEDVLVFEDDYLVEFNAELDARLSMVGPYYLHASFYHHISNIVRVPFVPEEPK